MTLRIAKKYFFHLAGHKAHFIALCGQTNPLPFPQ